MKALVALALAALLGACEATRQAAADAELERIGMAMALPVVDRQYPERDRVIAMIEQAGCVVTEANAAQIFADIGLPEAETRRITAELVDDGLAWRPEPGIFRLQTPACAI